MTKLYDIEIDLSSGHAGLPRDSFKDWMRVRLYGHSEDRRLVIPAVIAGSVYFKNDGLGDVELFRGNSTRVRIECGAIVHVMFDGVGMARVGS